MWVSSASVTATAAEGKAGRDQGGHAVACVPTSALPSQRVVGSACPGLWLKNPPTAPSQAVDGIFHVCRAFDDADVVHVEDRVDPMEGERAWQLVWDPKYACLPGHAAAAGALDPAGCGWVSRCRSHFSPTPADLEIVHSELRAKDIERIQGVIESLKKLIPR